MKTPLRLLVCLVSLIVIPMILLSMLSGCARREYNQASLRGSHQASNVVTVKGSDTMVHLVSTWAENFMKANPGLQVSVTGGGSGTGVAALLNQTTDVAATSRALSEKEQALAQKNNLHPQEIIVGQDGIAVVVNPKNPVKSLTMQQLAKIYTGELTNWKELGGPDEPVLIFSRESSSGTYVFFREHVLKNKDYTEKARLLPSSATVVESVASDVAGIGYVGLGYAENAGSKIKVLPIQPEGKNQPVAPSTDTVKSGEYPIARPLYFYTAGNAKPNVQKFIDFTLSPEGQRIIQDIGYIPAH